MSYTQLKANVTGAITARGAESGEVVQPGQMIFQVARQDGRDAVFDVPAQVIRSAPPDPKIIVALTDDPVRDGDGARAASRSAGRPDHADISGQGEPDRSPGRHAARRDGYRTHAIGVRPGISIPASALTSIDSQPAVWIVDPSSLTVSLHNVDVQRFDPGTVVISQGLEGGEIVVTAGIQALHPGQKVRLLGSPS